MNTDDDGITADSIFEYVKNLEYLLKKSEDKIEYLRGCWRNEELRHAATRSDLVAFKNACVRAPAGSLVFAHKKEQLQGVGEEAFKSELGVLIEPQAMSQCVAAMVKAILEELERTGGLYEIPIQRAGSQVQEASDLDGQGQYREWARSLDL